MSNFFFVFFVIVQYLNFKVNVIVLIDLAKQHVLFLNGGPTLSLLSRKATEETSFCRPFWMEGRRFSGI